MGSTKSPTTVDLSRRSICISQPEPNVVIHEGNQKFTQELGKWYAAEESKALEGLLELKDALKSITNDDDFWSYLAERMAEIVGGQMSFISKRILVDEQDTAVEMPPIGEPGACLMASAFHYNDGKGTSNTMKAFKYHAYGCPCGYMRHDKVFVVPEKLNNFSPDNPNELPFSCDAYIGIPLFADGKCFAHFGVMWSDEGAKQRSLSWAVIELLLHSLEDVILQRLLGGTHFSGGDTQSRDRTRIIPHDAITAAQSLKPYARSLSHELRTPMQGVVGMLDVMYATVLEAAEGQRDPEVRKIFETLRENIEIVQDSSRRAVEAADNVVHAYDMDLHVPDAPHTIITGHTDSRPKQDAPSSQQERPNILVAGSNLPIERPNKRRRADDVPSSVGSPPKVQATRAAWAHRSEPSEDLKRGVHEAEELPGLNTPSLDTESFDVTAIHSPPKSDLERSVAPGLRHTQLRNVLQYVVNEGLKIGGRPESAIARETDYGEIIEVRTKNPNGEERQKLVEWYVDSAVPETIFVDERDLGKLVSCVFLNAIKFTSQGRITVTARLSAQGRHIVIKVSDSGPGIPAAFLPKLFKPFSQEDGSLTRQSEGLGLGLLVAKGIARKLGGDLLCTRADTSGPDHGSDFEVRIPVAPGDRNSRPGSPLRSSSATAASAHKQSTSPPLVSPPIITTEPIKSAQKEAAGPRRPSLDLAMRSATMPPPRPVPLFTLPFAPGSPLPADGHKRPPLIPRKSSATIGDIDKNLALKYPLTFLVAEDNKINRKLLVSMLTKFGYKNVHEAYDGAEAVRQMEKHRMVDVVLMDLWMPFMDGYEATEKILSMQRTEGEIVPTILAVTADVTDGALEKAAKVGMRGFMTKPFKLLDLQRLIMEYCSQQSDSDNRYKAADDSGPSPATNGSAPPIGTPVACP